MRWRMGEAPRVRVTRRMRGRLTSAPNRWLATRAELATKAELAAAAEPVMATGQIRRTEPTMRALTERMATIYSAYGGFWMAPVKRAPRAHFWRICRRERGKGGDGDATTAIVYWTERGDLPVAAERVLDAYADVCGVILGASGYLDMYGNVWGALVRRGDAWCDVVLVSTEDGEQSVVRVARVLAGSV